MSCFCPAAFRQVHSPTLFSLQSPAVVIRVSLHTVTSFRELESVKVVEGKVLALLE